MGTPDAEPFVKLTQWCQSRRPLHDSKASRAVAVQILEINPRPSRVVHRTWFGSLTPERHGFRGTVETTSVPHGETDGPLNVEILYPEGGPFYARLEGAGLDPAIWSSGNDAQIIINAHEPNGTVSLQIENDGSVNPDQIRFKTVLSPTFAISRT
jgi:hypothetical protein